MRVFSFSTEIHLKQHNIWEYTQKQNFPLQNKNLKDYFTITETKEELLKNLI